MITAETKDAALAIAEADVVASRKGSTERTRLSAQRDAVASLQPGHRLETYNEAATRLAIAGTGERGLLTTGDVVANGIVRMPVPNPVEVVVETVDAVDAERVR